MKKGILIGFFVGLIVGLLLNGPYVPVGGGNPVILNTWTGTITIVKDSVVVK